MCEWCNVKRITKTFKVELIIDLLNDSDKLKLSRCSNWDDDDDEKNLKWFMTHSQCCWVLILLICRWWLLCVWYDSNWGDNMISRIVLSYFLEGWLNGVWERERFSEDRISTKGIVKKDTKITPQATPLISRWLNSDRLKKHAK